MYQVRFTEDDRKLTTGDARREGVVDERRRILWVDATLPASRRRVVLDALWRAAHRCSRAALVPVLHVRWMADLPA